MKNFSLDTAALSRQLTQLLSSTELTLSDEQLDKIVALVGLLHKWNKAYNLTSVRDPQQMMIRHMLDSLVVSPYLHGDHIADVGTGPGLPGLPLAIANPDKTFVLIDSLGKRINFIRQACHDLALNNVVAVQSRVENYEPEQPFTSVISRAFASLADMLSWCHHLPSTDGRFIALKGQLDATELQDIPSEFVIESEIRLAVPQLHAERHLVVLKAGA